jgi:hypothetical protein
MRVAALVLAAQWYRSCRWRHEEQSDGRAKRKIREGGLSLGVAATGDKDRVAYVADDHSCVWATGAWPSSWRAHEANGRMPFKRRLRLTSGPRHFFDLSRFSILQTLKFKIVTFPMSKLHQFFHRDSWKHREQLSFLAQLQIPRGLQVIVFWDKLKFQSFLNFKGIQTFL